MKKGISNLREAVFNALIHCNWGILPASFIEPDILKAGAVEYKKSVKLVRISERRCRNILFMAKTLW